MITLTQPSIAINDYRMFAQYFMEYNFQVWNYGKRFIVQHVAELAKASKYGKFDNVVINCHGNSGAIKLGKGWFKRKHIFYFRRWRGLVERIWITACEVALIEGSKAKDDGNMFCSELARAAKCYVVASTAIQKNLPGLYPYGQLDSFEGTVLEYSPEGKVVWTKTYGSWITNLE